MDQQTQRVVDAHVSSILTTMKYAARFRIAPKFSLFRCSATGEYAPIEPPTKDRERIARRFLSECGDDYTVRGFLRWMERLGLVKLVSQKRRKREFLKNHVKKSVDPTDTLVRIPDVASNSCPTRRQPRKEPQPMFAVIRTTNFAITIKKWPCLWYFRNEGGCLSIKCGWIVLEWDHAPIVTTEEIYSSEYDYIEVVEVDE